MTQEPLQIAYAVFSLTAAVLSFLQFREIWDWGRWIALANAVVQMCMVIFFLFWP